MGRLYRGYGLRPEWRGGGALGLRDGLIGGGQLPQGSRSPMFAAIEEGFTRPFRGLTTDGRPVEGLFPLRETPCDTRPAVDAATSFLDCLDPGQRAAAVRPLEVAERRVWTNAFAFWEPWGVCLEQLTPAQREAAMGTVGACLSSRGLELTRTVMRLNEALGELIDALQDSLREWMYWLTIFGTPSPTEPWGWQLMGHHLIYNCLIRGSQMVLTPAFLGAEPSRHDEGPYAGLSAFDEEQDRALAVVSALTAAQRERAILFPSMLSAELPPALTSRDEGRHRGGAGRDNAVVPYEGIPAAELSEGQRRALLALVQTYVGRLAEDHAAEKMAEVHRHLGDTYFCWIGPHEKGEPFYYKVHSPVLWIEFDNHPGIFLDNDEPEPFHVHTIVRTPNGNDYGMDLLRQHYERFHAGTAAPR